MAASQKTVTDILTVVWKHLTPEQWRKVLHDLESVDGNNSFKETIKRLKERTT